jgi:hypothetical protein
MSLLNGYTVEGLRSYRKLSEKSELLLCVRIPNTDAFFFRTLLHMKLISTPSQQSTTFGLCFAKDSVKVCSIIVRTVLATTTDTQFPPDRQIQLLFHKIQTSQSKKIRENVCAFWVEVRSNLRPHYV